jgi:hypothetical protein
MLIVGIILGAQKTGEACTAVDQCTLKFSDARKSNRVPSEVVHCSRDLPTGKGEPLVKRRYGAVEKPSGGRGFSYHEYVILRYEQATKLMIEDRTQVLYHGAY